MITVTHLKKSFGNVHAINDLSFTINKGEIVGFLGPNGAGKTTTMRMITGFLTPDEGEIIIDGEPLEKNLAQTQAKIGYLPENNPLYKEMLVSEMLTTAANLKNIPQQNRAQALDFVVSSVSIKDVYYRPISELSKGYKQRVGMAVALLGQPQILILDEPTEGLDPNQRTEIRNLIKELAKDRTIILSTHVMQEATAIASRILIISNGKVAADGTADSLTKQNRSEKIIELELEGQKILTAIKLLKGLKDFDSEKIKGSRYKLKLNVSSKSDIQPQLSELIAKNKWTIWKLNEVEHKLEDVFHQLTTEA